MGRPAGSLNAATVTGRERLNRYTAEAIEYSLATMRGRVKCIVCDGSGKQPVTQKNGKMGERECQSCLGRGREIIKPELRFSAAQDIMDRGGIPKQKQTEISGTIEVEASKIIEALHRGRERAAKK